MMPPAIRLSYDVQPDPERWLLDENEEPMPEGTLHQQAMKLLQLVLEAFVARAGLDALVACNLAVRWDKDHPGVGVDPDVALFEPHPRGERNRRSVRLWQPRSSAPRVAIEVVSFHQPGKDYLEGPEKYAASGTRELWVFDPELHGPELHGGPFRLQVWRRSPKGAFRREYAGTGPAYSRELKAFLVVTDGGDRLRLADDMGGARLWPTEAEAERAGRLEERDARLQAEQARAQAEKEKQQAERDKQQAENDKQQAENDKQRAEQRASEAEAQRAALEAELARLKGGGAPVARHGTPRKQRRLAITGAQAFRPGPRRVAADAVGRAPRLADLGRPRHVGNILAERGDHGPRGSGHPRRTWVTMARTTRRAPHDMRPHLLEGSVRPLPP
jgi:Uma2 family endonuclease